MKPVYFYTYDLEEYARDTGLNIDLEAEMPGCVYRDAAALAAGAVPRVRHRASTAASSLLALIRIKITSLRAIIYHNDGGRLFLTVNAKKSKIFFKSFYWVIGPPQPPASIRALRWSR